MNNINSDIHSLIEGVTTVSNDTQLKQAADCKRHILNFAKNCTKKCGRSLDPQIFQETLKFNIREALDCTSFYTRVRILENLNHVYSGLRPRSTQLVATIVNSLLSEIELYHISHAQQLSSAYQQKIASHSSEFSTFAKVIGEAGEENAETILRLLEEDHMDVCEGFSFLESSPDVVLNEREVNGDNRDQARLEMAFLGFKGITFAQIQISSQSEIVKTAERIEDIRAEAIPEIPNTPPSPTPNGAALFPIPETPHTPPLAPKPAPPSLQPVGVNGRKRPFETISANQPQGIQNSGNACYRIAALQILMTMPAFGNLLIKAQKESSRPLLEKKAIATLSKLYERYQEGASSRELRTLEGAFGSAICAWGATKQKLDPSPYVQDFASTILSLVTELLGVDAYFVSILLETPNTMADELIKQEAIKQKFSQEQSLLVSVSRLMTLVRNRLVKRDFRAQLKDRCVEIEGVSYQLKSFTIHEGRDHRSGHYTACVEREGKWFYCNDYRIQQISELQLVKYLEKADMLHFEKQHTE